MEDEINLLDYWRVLVKRKWLIVGLTLICAFSALIYSVRQPKLYKATATIMTVEGGGGGLASALAAVPFLGGVGGGSGGEAKLAPILQSATLAMQVAQELDLEKFFPEISKMASWTREQKLKSAASKLRGAVGARSLKGLLGISVLWEEPEQAAELSNCYVFQLGKFLNSRSLNVNFHVIDPAVRPWSVSKPKTKQNVVVGTLLGLFMGVFIVFFWEYLEKLPKTD